MNFLLLPSLNLINIARADLVLELYTVLTYALFVDLACVIYFLPKSVCSDLMRL